MNLVSTLSAGVAAAANGTAEIYDRGTSDRSTVYYTFEGATPDSSGANIALDSYGSVEVYVNDLVDIVVKNSDGVPVRTFTEGHSAPVVEVRSLSFGGIDYDTHAFAPGNPTTLQAVLDRWLTSAGATDFQVSVGGSTFNLSEAFGSLSGLVYNVKSPVYGAVGDGVTNDTAAIGAALAAAVAAGGGIVFLPKGTYLITTSIEWSHLVSLVGIGADLSIITTNSASNNRILTWTTGTAKNMPIRIEGVAFAATQANTGSQLYSTVAVNIQIDRCHLGAASFCTGKCIEFAGTSQIKANSSRFTQYAVALAIGSWTAAAHAEFVSCTFETGGTDYTASMIEARGYTKLIGCKFDLSSDTLTAPNYAIQMFNNTDWLFVSGCEIYSTSQYPLFGIRLIADAYCFAVGNKLTSFTGYYSLASGIMQDRSFLETPGVSRQSGAGAAYSVPADSRYIHEIASTGAVPTVTITAPLFMGQEMIVATYNNSGGAWVTGIVFSGAQTGTSTGSNLANGSSRQVTFVAVDLLAAGTWVWRVKSVVDV